jgi:hypothetical protein
MFADDLAVHVGDEPSRVESSRELACAVACSCVVRGEDFVSTYATLRGDGTCP